MYVSLACVGVYMRHICMYKYILNYTAKAVEIANLYVPTINMLATPSRFASLPLFAL